MAKQRQNSSPLQAVTTVGNGVVVNLFDIGDIEVLRTKAVAWLMTMDSPGALVPYIASFSLASALFGWFVYWLDVEPSYRFGLWLADILQNAGLLTTSVAQVGGLILMLSLLPNLFEFTAAGLSAFGNRVLALALQGSIVFDLITDTPRAYQIADAVTRELIANPLVQKILAVIGAGVLVVIVSLLLEIIFLSFVIALVAAIIRSLQLRRMQVAAADEFPEAAYSRKHKQPPTPHSF